MKRDVTMHADLHSFRPLRKLAWLLALLLVAGQTQAVVHALQHVTPALIDHHEHAGTQAHHHAHGNNELSLSCELCAAGHVTLAGLPPEAVSTPAALRWLDARAETPFRAAPLHPPCRDPPHAG